MKDLFAGFSKLDPKTYTLVGPMKRNYDIQPIEDLAANGFADAYKAEYPDLPTPVELTPDDLVAFKLTLKGYDFYSVSALICPKCGKFQSVKRIFLPDKSEEWYLIFTCEHYKAVAATPTNTDPVVPTAQEASDGGSDSVIEADPQQQQ